MQIKESGYKYVEADFSLYFIIVPIGCIDRAVGFVDTFCGKKTSF